MITTPIVDTADPDVYSHTFSDLTPGERYVFAVSVYNEIFESSRTATIEVIAATLPSKPDPITRASAGVTEIGIQWTEPDSGNNPITGYIIESDGGNGGSFS